MVKTNLLGVMHGVQLALMHMAKGDTVVNVASLAGLTPTPSTPAYGATKAGVVAYTRSLSFVIGFRKIQAGFKTSPLNWLNSRLLRHWPKLKCDLNS